MTTKLKNHSSTVPVSRSVENIEKLLVTIGASRISREYNNSQELSGFIFQVDFPNQAIAVSLPARVDRVYEKMRTSIKRPRKDTLKNLKDQAARTAWKRLHEWIHLEIGFVESGQKDAREVFMPYMVTDKRGTTVFEKFLENPKLMIGTAIKKEKEDA